MKGKSTFTQSEANSIIALIREKSIATPNAQKRIRDKIRAIGFYASDFGIGDGYKEQDFLSVVKIIKDGTKPTKSLQKELSGTNYLIKKTRNSKRQNSDEAYIIDLCDYALKAEAERQHRFDFLRGDAGTKLPVDAYYSSFCLVIEYCERQHTEDVNFFNRRQTVSGMNRGEQRKKYDQLRRDELPKHKIVLIEFGSEEFEHNRSKQLIRNKENDMKIIRNKLKAFIKK
ncbi:MAG: hypothetical protein Q7W13_16420 [Bacteroidia bacterium]|nr:hypothetical protein [Bacteroidia bacterium]